MTNLAKNILYVLAGIAAVLWLVLVSPIIALGFVLLVVLVFALGTLHEVTELTR